MATTKKKTIVLGSLYEFSELASAEVIQNDKDAHHDPEAATFFSFDATNQIFCADIDQDDQDSMLQFLTRMAGYIEHHQSNQPGFDDEPRIRPVEGTVMGDIIPEEYDEDSAEKIVLLQYQSDDESDNQDALDGLLHLTTYWQPAKGNIGILPPMYAKDITRLTGSSLFAEEAEKRYRIFQGDFNLAHEKLLRLEPLLEIFERQSGSQSFPATGNLLIWPPNQPDSRMEFVTMGVDHPGYQRVIVNRMEQHLSRKVITELRQWDTKKQVFHTPPNLQKEAYKPTATFEASKLWDTEVYTSFGDPKNMDPIITSNPTSVHKGDPVTTQERPDARIAAWTSNIVHSANPEIAPEAPMESAAPTRRRVAVESDSEDEDPSVPMPKPVPSAPEDFKEPPLVSQSEEVGLKEAESQPDQDTEALLSPSLNCNESTLMELSTEVNMNQAAGESQSQSEDRSPLPHEGHEVDSTTVSDQDPAPANQKEGDNTGVSNDLTTVSDSTPTNQKEDGNTGVLNDSTTVSDPTPANQKEDDNTGVLNDLTTVSDSAPTNQKEDDNTGVLNDSTTVSDPTPANQKEDDNTRVSNDLTTVSDSAPTNQKEDGNTGVSNETPDNFQSQSNPCLSSEAPSHHQAAEPTEVEDISSSAGDIASVIPQPPRALRPSFYTGEYQYGSSTRPYWGHRGQRGDRGGINTRNRGSSWRGTGQTCDHSESQRLAQVDSFVPAGRARGFNPRANGRLRASYSAERSTRSRGFRGQPSPYTRGPRVDPGTPAISGRSSTVPPGLDCNASLLAATTTRGNLNQSSDPREPLPSSAAPSELPTRSNETSRSSASGLSRLRFSEEGSDYVTTFIPILDQSAMRERSIQQVQEAIAAMNKKAEEESPKLHSTMRQQGRNPGRTTAKPETEAEKKARIAAALADAYPSSTSTPPRSQTASPKPEEMSKWKRDRIKKQSTLAEARPGLVASDLRAVQTKKLISLLEPAFESGRAFSGKLTFELQFGQILITPGLQLRDQVYHSVDDWNSYFGDRPGSTHTLSNFTNILTTNGADIDRFLNMKSKTGNGTGKIWKSSPAPQSVSYEFHCQSRFNEDFQIVIDQFGGYELRKGLVTVGDINIHVPGQVWDLSATLTGPLKWPDPPDAITQSVSAFVESLYVLPGRNKLQLVFRQPNDREIEVRNLIVKRDSYHSSNRLGGEDVLLKVTEAKNLQFRVHPEDKKLWQGYEGPEESYKDFADGGHIHYEMSLVHREINDVLAKNEALEIGELTDAETTGKSLLDFTIMHCMLDIAVQIVTKLDFVGIRNYGTQQRLADNDRKHIEQLEAILGPRAQTILQHSHATREPSQVASRAQVVKNNGTAAGEASVVQQYVPGIRMNTQAQVVIDEAGHRYRLGLGGARIPLGDDENKSGSGESVIPDDSASQAAAVKGPAVIGYKITERRAGFW